LLRSGVAALEIERRLTSQGLSPGAAAAVVDRVLGDQARRQVEPLQQAEWRNRLHRIVSGALGAAFVVIAFVFLGTWAACRTALGMLLPLACTWFPDAMAFRKMRSLGSPWGSLILRWLGWLFLLLIGSCLLEIILFTQRGGR
jgi:hypothetical protein